MSRQVEVQPVGAAFRFEPPVRQHGVVEEVEPRNPHWAPAIESPPIDRFAAARAAIAAAAGWANAQPPVDNG